MMVETGPPWYMHGESSCGELTINEPVDYMPQAVMILMRGKDITWAIGRGGS